MFSSCVLFVCLLFNCLLFCVLVCFCKIKKKQKNLNCYVHKSMITESQFCWTGDHTIEATRTAMKQVAEAKAENRYVIVLSDANFSRYGIKPSDFSELMLSDQAVKVFAIFIGSLGDQAIR